jgi:hypothetical protein
MDIQMNSWVSLSIWWRQPTLDSAHTRRMHVQCTKRPSTGSSAPGLRTWRRPTGLQERRQIHDSARILRHRTRWSSRPQRIYHWTSSRCTEPGLKCRQHVVQPSTSTDKPRQLGVVHEQIARRIRCTLPVFPQPTDELEGSWLCNSPQPTPTAVRWLSERNSLERHFQAAT